MYSICLRHPLTSVSAPSLLLNKKGAHWMLWWGRSWREFPFYYLFIKKSMQWVFPMSTPSLPIPSRCTPSTHPTLFQFFSTHLVQLILPIYSRCCGLLLQNGWLLRGYTLWENWLFLQPVPVANSSSTRVRPSCLPPFFMLVLLSGFRLHSFRACCHNLWVHIFSCSVVSRGHCFILFTR